MARVKNVAIEIMIKCKKLNLDIDYFKLQKLAYICQCIHYSRFGVNLCPEEIWNFSDGGGFKEIFSLFNINNIDTMCDNLTLSKLERINVLLDNKYYYDLLLFEKATVNFVINKYGDMDSDELKIMIKNDPIYKKIKIGDEIKIEKLNDLFITQREIEELGNINYNNDSEIKLIKKYFR